MNKRENFEFMLKIFEESGLKFVPYPQTYMVNAEDEDGVIQSYFTSTGTAVFRDGNDKYKSQKHTERDMPVDDFIALCKGTSDRDITEFFD